MGQERDEHPVATGASLRVLVLQALGVVYGDIATSPLYAFRTCFDEQVGTTPTPAHVLGILSLVFWSLILLISLKYAIVVLRADLRGEGGILALLTLVTGTDTSRSRSSAVLVGLGLFGAALLYGDGMITPAMSVLSAIEGLEVATPHFKDLVVPLTAALLVALFLLQRRGTLAVGSLFGPVMVVWFACLIGLGLYSIARAPHALAAVNPAYGIDFLTESPRMAFLALGSVFLVVTGAEAMYADLGHFGRRPIRVAWFALVLPALLINYFGQGALVLVRPEAASHSFYYLAPEWALLPLVGLATSATVIASQAIISGAFSLTYQGVQLGLFPRLDIRHYSAEGEGRVYVPMVNWGLLAAAVLLVVTFRTSDHLAAAYGVAVSGTMAITSVLLFACMRRLWGWHWLAAAAVAGSFLAVEIVFLSANLVKIPEGGWVPLLVAAVLFTTMTTWKRGRELVVARERELRISVEDFCRRNLVGTRRVPGTAIYVTRETVDAPYTLLRNLASNKVLHEQVVLLNIRIEAVPRVPVVGRITIDEVESGFRRVVAHYGFMQQPNIPVVLRQLAAAGVTLKQDDLTFFAARDRFFVADSREMSRWRKHLFVFLVRNSRPAVIDYRIPPEQLFEIGITLQL